MLTSGSASGALVGILKLQEFQEMFLLTFLNRPFLSEDTSWSLFEEMHLLVCASLLLKDKRSVICICAVCISWGPEEEVGAPLCYPTLGSACGG